MITSEDQFIDGLKGARVLVTGATGFIGAQLTHRLVSAGALVAIMHRATSSLHRLADLPQLDTFVADLRDEQAITRAVQTIQPRFVFHLAAAVDVSRDSRKSQEMIENNLNGTINLLNALQGIEYQRFVNTGTCEEYGDNPVPFHEAQNFNPVSPYSASKAAATLFCQMLHKTSKLPIVTVRPFLTFGPNQNLQRLIPQAIMAALDNRNLPMTEGVQTREFNYVSNIVDGFLLTALNPNVPGEIINIGCGEPYTLREVVSLIYELTGSSGKPNFGELEYRSGESFAFFCDNTKSREMLQWYPRVGLREGLERTISWYRDHRDRGVIVR
ncbi:MAG: SDR family NAD(P)-dependent oxidoreductase [Planctomycetaceae bacterium]|nr:SDR family NAD(P)-dependent oxidoreductase [Planctomycetaceae bacterium]